MVGVARDLMSDSCDSLILCAFGDNSSALNLQGQLRNNIDFVLATVLRVHDIRRKGKERVVMLVSARKVIDNSAAAVYMAVHQQALAELFKRYCRMLSINT